MFKGSLIAIALLLVGAAALVWLIENPRLERYMEAAEAPLACCRAIRVSATLVKPEGQSRCSLRMTCYHLRKRWTFGGPAVSSSVDGADAAVGSDAVSGSFAVLPDQVSHVQALRLASKSKRTADPFRNLLE